MLYLIFLVLIVVGALLSLNYYLEYHNEQEQKLIEQKNKQRVATNTSELKTFVLNTYGSDGGYYDFRVDLPWETDPKDGYYAISVRFTAGGSNPRWKDRDGSEWKMLQVSQGRSWSWPHPGYTKVAHDYGYDTNLLSCGSHRIERDEFFGTWSFSSYSGGYRGDHGYHGRYDTPYQAKLAGQKFEYECCEDDF